LILFGMDPDHRVFGMKPERNPNSNGTAARGASVDACSGSTPNSNTQKGCSGVRVPIRTEKAEHPPLETPRGRRESGAEALARFRLSPSHARFYGKPTGPRHGERDHPMKTYTELLAVAEATDNKEDWAVVTAIERAEMAKRCMPGPGAADYLHRHPLCASCDARGLRAEATHAVYVLVAREAGWPVRGCDIGGYPNDPQHRWNEGEH
jgi:hypothetical protein